MGAHRRAGVVPGSLWFWILGVSVISRSELAVAQSGRELFDSNCAACHGAGGVGGSAPSLTPFGMDDRQLLGIVRNGASEMMMTFSRATISDDEVAHIGAYLRALAPVDGASGDGGAEIMRDTSMVEWPVVGGDPHNQRYSPIADLTRQNVDELDVAWTWRPEERPMPEFGTIPGNFTSTPLMIDGVLYVSTNYNRVAALDAESGEVKWIFDPRAYELGMPTLAGGFRHRGVTAWRDGDRLKIFLASRYRLYSIDAETGELTDSFGDGGLVDTAKDLSWEVNPAHFEINGPPAIYNDLVIVGSAIGDRLLYKRAPPGDVRAYHARTGELAWTWSPIPGEGEFGADTWENESWRDAGQVEVWPGVTVDEQRGIVYAPTGNPTNLYYGGSRLGDNLFAQSLVALDAETGERRWHYQLIHHDMWDYSLPAQPILADLSVDGREIPAVIQLTKHGYIFAFNRENGEPIWTIEERPVPASDIPGERASTTQPFPTRPPHVLPTQGVTLADAFNLTPELREEARRELQRYRLGPLFTPPTLEGTAIRPSSGGAVSWGGGAIDPESGILYIKVSDQPAILGLEKYDPATSNNPFAATDQADWIGYDVASGGASFRNGIPLTKPPYAYLVAMNMRVGELLWRVPFGRGSDALRDHPDLRGVRMSDRLGTPGPPGAIVTAGGLVFVGGGDNALYAFDTDTGEELWSYPLPRRTSGIPMTYRTGSGRQFVVIATGSGTDQELIAFAVPRP